MLLLTFSLWNAVSRVPDGITAIGSKSGSSQPLSAYPMTTPNP